MGISSDEKEKIIQELDKRIRLKNPNFKCSMCGNTNFSLIDGYTKRFLSQSLNVTNVGMGISVPSISVVCTYCGFIADFSLGVLGFLKEESKNKEGKDGGK